ncbi:hypothetical protein EJB05_55040, partial [Eragrostis curvula]
MDPMIGVAGGLNDYSRVIVLAGERYEDALLRLEKRRELQRLAIMAREERKKDEAAMVLAEVEMMASRLETQDFFHVPACSMAILALPMAMVGETAEQGCAVCGQLFQEGDQLRSMPCSHSFHQSCIFKSLLVSCVCPRPRCRFTMPAAAEEY